MLFHVILNFIRPFPSAALRSAFLAFPGMGFDSSNQQTRPSLVQGLWQSCLGPPRQRLPLGRELRRGQDQGTQRCPLQGWDRKGRPQTDHPR